MPTLTDNDFMPEVAKLPAPLTDADFTGKRTLTDADFTQSQSKFVETRQSPYTQLGPEEHKEYEKWAGEIAAKRFGKPVDNVQDFISKEDQDYDLAGAYKETMAKGNLQGDNGHFPDTFKKPTHPTFSTESKYSTPEQSGGTWTQENGADVFTPATWQVDTPEKVARLKEYLQRADPSVVLKIPEAKSTLPPYQGLPGLMPPSPVAKMGLVPEEQKIEPISGGKHWFNAFMRGATGMAAGALKQYGRVVYGGGAAIREKLGMEQIVGPDISENATTELGQRLAKMAEEKFPLDKARETSFLQTDVPMGMGSIGGTLPAAIFGGVAAALGVGGFAEADDAYDREVERQKKSGKGIDYGKAMYKSLGYGAIATVIEAKLGVGRLLGKFEKYFGEKTAKELGRELLKKGVSWKNIWNFVKERGKDFAAGSAEEALQRLSQDLIVEGKTELKPILREAGAGGIAQAVFGGAGHVTGLMLTPAEQVRTAISPEVEAQFPNIIEDTFNKILDARAKELGLKDRSGLTITQEDVKTAQEIIAQGTMTQPTPSLNMAEDAAKRNILVQQHGIPAQQVAALPVEEELAKWQENRQQAETGVQPSPESGITPPAQTSQAVPPVQSAIPAGSATEKAAKGPVADLVRQNEAERAAVAQPQAVTPAQTPIAKPTMEATVPLMITKKMESDLKTRGLTQEAINVMTPQEANDVLAQPFRPPVVEAREPAEMKQIVGQKPLTPAPGATLQPKERPDVVQAKIAELNALANKLPKKDPKLRVIENARIDLQNNRIDVNEVDARLKAAKIIEKEGELYARKIKGSMGAVGGEAPGVAAQVAERKPGELQQVAGTQEAVKVEEAGRPARPVAEEGGVKREPVTIPVQEQEAVPPVEQPTKPVERRGLVPREQPIRQAPQKVTAESPQGEINAERTRLRKEIESRNKELARVKKKLKAATLRGRTIDADTIRPVVRQVEGEIRRLQEKRNALPYRALAKGEEYERAKTAAGREGVSGDVEPVQPIGRGKEEGVSPASYPGEQRRKRNFAIISRKTHQSTRQRLSEGDYGENYLEVQEVLNKGTQPTQWTKEHQSFAEEADKFDTDVVFCHYPSSNVGGAFLPFRTKDGRRIMVVNYIKDAGHELFHAKLDAGDPDAVRLFNAVNEVVKNNTGLVKAYQRLAARTINPNRNVEDVVSYENAIEDIAADIASGELHRFRDLNLESLAEKVEKLLKGKEYGQAKFTATEGRRLPEIGLTRERGIDINKDTSREANARLIEKISQRGYGVKYSVHEEGEINEETIKASSRQEGRQASDRARRQQQFEARRSEALRAERKGEKTGWEKAEHEETYYQNSEFNEKRQFFNDRGIDVVPVKGGFFRAEYNPKDKVVFIATDDSKLTVFDLMDHEKFHILADEGNPDAVAIIQNINPESAEFARFFSEYVNSPRDLQSAIEYAKEQSGKTEGVEFETAFVKHIAVEYVGDFVGGDKSLLQGFKDPKYAAETSDKIRGIGEKPRFAAREIESDKKYLNAVKSGNLKEAQRMVDEKAKEKGYNLKLFHGSPAESITEFYPFTHVGTKNQVESLTEGRSRQLGREALRAMIRKKYPVFVKVDNPLRIEDLHDMSPVALLRQIDPKTAATLSSNETETRSKIFKTAEEKVESTFKKDFHNALKRGSNYPPQRSDNKYQQIRLDAQAEWNNYIRGTAPSNARKELIKAMGNHDALVYKNKYEEGGAVAEQPKQFVTEFIHTEAVQQEDSYIIPRSSQIKSADPVTRDANGNIIPLSERFNERTPDIRFAAVGQRALRNIGREEKNEELLRMRDGLMAARVMMDKAGIKPGEKLKMSEEKENNKIRIATGWYKGFDGKMRFEITDNRATINWDALQKLRSGATTGIKIKNVLNHPSLYQLYPDIAEIKIIPEEMNAMDGASYDPKDEEITLNRMHLIGPRKSSEAYLKRTLLHEIQHMIQEEEGFERGGTPLGVATGREWDMWFHEGVLADAAITRYMKLGGETEARTTSRRMEFNEEGRRLSNPIEYQKGLQRGAMYAAAEPVTEETRAKLPADVGNEKPIDTSIDAKRDKLLTNLVTKFRRFLPAFRGGKDKMTIITSKAVHEVFTPEQRAAITEIHDYFGGGGNWGLFLGMANHENARDLHIYEQDIARMNRIKWQHEKGDRFLELWKTSGLKDALMPQLDAMFMTGGRKGEGVSSGTSVQRIAKELLAKTTNEDAKNILQAIIDHTTARFETNDIKQMINAIANESMNAKDAADQWKARHGKTGRIFYHPGDSYQSKPVTGKHVLSVLDPPYYNTKGYDGKPVAEDTYQKTRDLAERLIKAGNNLIYTDEAWWLKKTPPPQPEVGKKILKDLYNMFSNFDVVRGKIATRNETIGVHNGFEYAQGKGVGVTGKNVYGRPQPVRAGEPGITGEPGGAVVTGVEGEGRTIREGVDAGERIRTPAEERSLREAERVARQVEEKPELGQYVDEVLQQFKYSTIAKLRKRNLKSPADIDETDIKDYVILGAFEKARGYDKLSIFAPRMTRLYGDAITPRMNDIWQAAKKLDLREALAASSLAERINRGLGRVATPFGPYRGKKAPMPAPVEPAGLVPKIPPATPPAAPTLEEPRRGLVVTPAEPVTPEKPVSAPTAPETAKRGITGIKNAIMDEERAALGLPPRLKPLRQEAPDVYDRVMAKLDQNPGLGRKLVEELKLNMRPTSADEVMVLMHETAVRRHAFDMAMEEVSSATTDEERVVAKKQLEIARDDFYDVARVAELAGMATARGLQFRRNMIAEDYSLARLQADYRATVNDGKPLNTGQLSKVENMARQIEKERLAWDQYANLMEYERQVSNFTQSELEAEIKKLKQQLMAPKFAAREEEKQLPVAVGAKAEQYVKDLAQKGIRNMVDEAKGQAVLERLIDEGVKVNDVNKEFWNNTYDKLPPELQKKFQRQLLRDKGLREEDVKDWKAEGLDDNLDASEIENLQGTSRGFVSLMAVANERYGKPTLQGTQAQRPEAPKFAARTQEQKEASYLKSLKTRLRHAEAELQRRITEKDFTPKVRREPVVLDAEGVTLKYNYDKAKRQYEEMKFADMLKKQSIPAKNVRHVGEVINTSRAILTSLDLSAVLNQGGIQLLSHPIETSKAFGPMIRAMMSEKNEFEVMDEIYSRPNAPMYESLDLLTKKGTTLRKMEEVYMSRWIEKIPVWMGGGLVRASQRAYTTFLNRIRADAFDRLLADLVPTGKPTMEEAKAIAKHVLISTGRGDLGKHADAVATLSTIFFAPRNVVSRFQYILGISMIGGTSRTRVLIAKEYARYLGSVGFIMALALAAGANIEDDWTSADWGVLRFGKIRIDLLSGLKQATVFLGRTVMGKKKKSTGEISPLRGYGTPYKDGWSNEALTFLRYKLSPAVGMTWDVFSGETFDEGRMMPATPGRIAKKMAPITPMEIYRNMRDAGMPVGSALALLSIFGARVNVYEPHFSGKTKSTGLLEKPTNFNKVTGALKKKHGQGSL
jgi:hypothetical protein